MITRRSFLRALGIGAAAVAAPAILMPERRIWQVSMNAPVRCASRDWVNAPLDWSGYTTAAPGAWSSESGGNILEAIREAQEQMKRATTQVYEPAFTFEQLHRFGGRYPVPPRPFVAVWPRYLDGV